MNQYEKAAILIICSLILYSGTFHNIEHLTGLLPDEAEKELSITQFPYSYKGGSLMESFDFENSAFNFGDFPQIKAQKIMTI